MAEHDVTLELWYDGAWHPAPVLTRYNVKYKRGSDSPGNDTDPAAGTATLDNGSEMYAPRSAVSPLYGKIGQNTKARLRVDGDALAALDSFDRTVSGGWSFALTGGGWTVSWTAGGPSNFDTAAGAGRMAVPAAGNYSLALLGDIRTDAPDVYLTGVTLPLATGGDLETGPLLCGVGLSTYYMLRAAVHTTNAIDLKIINVVNGVETTLATVASGLTHAATTPLNFRGQIAGGVVRFKAWQGPVEPSTWQAEATATVVRRGWVGVRSGRGGGNSNTTLPQFAYGDFSAAAGGTRMSGEIASWKPRRPVKGSGWTPIELAGVLRRIGRGTDPIESALTRATIALNPVAYWPLSGGYLLDSPIDGVQPLQVVAPDDIPGLVRQPKYGAVDLTPGSEKGVDLGGGARLLGPVSMSPSVTQWCVEFVTNPGNQTYSVDNVISPLVVQFDYGSSREWLQIEMQPPGYPGADNGQIEVAVFLSPFVITTLVCDADRNVFDNRAHQVRVNVFAGGGTVNLELWVDNQFVRVGSWSGTLGPVTSASANETAAADQPQWGFGHLAVYSVADPGDTWTPAQGYPGETAADRFARFCAEEGVAATIIGDPAESVAMGPQLPLKRLEILDEIARTDDAQIYESRDDVGLTMRTGASKLNQTPALTINYLGQIEPGSLEPVIGDQGIRNDVTAKNPSNASRRVQQLTGPHNVQLPEDDPQGVGRYQTSLDVNTAADAQLVDAAGWRVNLGTFDGTWYAEVTVDLDAAPGLVAAVNALDIGDVLALANLPVDEALDTVEGLIIGIEEDLPPKRRLVTFHLVPAAPYRVGILANPTGDTDPVVGRLESDGATLVAAVDPAQFLADGFEAGVALWVAQNGWTRAADSAHVQTGTTAVKMTPPGAVASGGIIYNGRAPVIAGRSYVVEAWFFSVSGWSDARATVDWRNAADSNFATSLGVATVVPAGVWTLSRQIVVAPAGAVTAQPRARQGGTPAATDALWVDDFAFYPALTVDTPSGPLWTTDPDDFPLDVIVGGQRVTVAGVAGAASPQTFLLASSGLPAYPMPAGADIVVAQPIILAQ